jgi:hypothetical protein
MNTRIFSALAAIAMSSAVVIPAMARDATYDTTATGRPAVSSQAGITQSGTTQSAQAMTPSRRDTYGSAYESRSGSSTSSDEWSRSDANDTVHGIGNNVMVGNGPGYAWWKDR